MNVRGFKNYQSMNMVFKEDSGSEIWIGDYYAATNLALLKQKKITAVLTTAAMLGIKYPQEAGISHKTLNAFDVPTYKMTPHFEQAYQFIKKSLESGNILVHCAAGISRSTTCVLVYLMRQKGYGFKQGLQIVRAKRPIVNPNYGFQSELAKYEQVLSKGMVKGTPHKQQQTAKQVQEEKDNFYKFVSKQMSKGGQLKNEKQSRHKAAQEPFRLSGKQIGATKTQRGQSLHPYMNNKTEYPSNRLNHLTFKLEPPKIVTIRK